ncbi:hypothetical protein A1O7_08488 [Cladophialophora yegresii CBS 114405]|uniref:Uncharacterized protein n=1 Tax=Cladophialophora yegresii CBS 114405 TaxID=1182544 RepID=W9VRB5_9EURO|nr:uncharacterized protein A1O7_08488 [Cladophialophora yegresii CBS 114405]EXJ55560.1 hypothetical protein A1O7_08488 [Cladophialophora yegresii CBS 114405]
MPAATGPMKMYVGPVGDATHCEKDDPVLHANVPGVHGKGRAVDVGEVEDEDEGGEVEGLVGVEVAEGEDGLELEGTVAMLVRSVVVDDVGPAGTVVERVVNIGDVDDAEVVVLVVGIADMVVMKVVKLVGTVVGIIIVVAVVELMREEGEALFEAPVLVESLLRKLVPVVAGKGKTVTVMFRTGKEVARVALVLILMLLLALVFVRIVLRVLGELIGPEPVIVVELSIDEGEGVVGQIVVDTAALLVVELERVVDKYTLVMTVLVVDGSAS